MQNDSKAFRKGRSQCNAVELFVVPHLYLQLLRTGQDKPLKNKDRRRTMFSSEQD